ncbi:hypothetical protein O0235_10845 [Tepidiforma flava]|uniref:UBA domain-containing protein n=1 Tax=Tepidiforma flava TaxID=3004094 RepID=A0ABY7M541_9CHLR|nr:hypothetical protein [Tepidiforma flava]WBL35277.1 hypothetical protein O0235_10845 [Tepidiforma flava]
MDPDRTVHHEAAERGAAAGAAGPGLAAVRYEVLDPILEAYVEDDRTVDEIVAMGFERETVERVVRMVDRNEYKRRQAAPGVKITPRAFGRDRRLPLADRSHR